MPNHQSFRVGSDFTHKVYQAGDVAIATFGEAFLQGRSIASHMDEFAAQHDGNCEHPGPTAMALADFFGERYDEHIQASGAAAPPPGVTALGFLVGGYDEDGVGEAREVSIPSRAVDTIATTQNGGGAAWRGQTDVVTRIVRGADLDLLAALANNAGKNAQLQDLMPELDGCGYVIPFDSMNLQDGIDFSVLCIRTTIDVQRLTLATHASIRNRNVSWFSTNRAGDGAGLHALGAVRVERTCGEAALWDRRGTA